MRIIGHGIDVVKVAGIKEELEPPTKRWARHFCSPAEREQAGLLPVPTRYYAGMFAGKEAVTKALGAGFAGDITWRGIEILRGESGAPHVRLSDEVLASAQSLGITGWFISISHRGEITTASVIAVADEEGLPKPNPAEHRRYAARGRLLPPATDAQGRLVPGGAVLASLCGRHPHRSVWAGPACLGLPADC